MRCSLSLIIRRMQIKTWLRCHLLPARQKFKSLTNSLLAKLWLNRGFYLLLLECKTTVPVRGNLSISKKTTYAFTQKSHFRNLIWPCGSNMKALMHKITQCSTIYHCKTTNRLILETQRSEAQCVRVREFCAAVKKMRHQPSEPIGKDV